MSPTAPASMEQVRPATIVPTGDQKMASWHYACQLYRQVSWYTLSRNHTPNVMAHPDGDCHEQGSTSLWEAVLLERHSPWLTRSRHEVPL